MGGAPERGSDNDDNILNQYRENCDYYWQKTFLDDFTKDETVASGEDASIKADFVLDLKR